MYRCLRQLSNDLGHISRKGNSLILRFFHFIEKTGVDSYPELMKQGRLTVGGGLTTDMQWVLSFTDGRFIRRQSDGYGGFHTRELPEEEAVDLLRNRKYGWVRFNDVKTGE